MRPQLSPPLSVLAAGQNGQNPADCLNCLCRFLPLVLTSGHYYRHWQVALQLVVLVSPVLLRSIRSAYVLKQLVHPDAQPPLLQSQPYLHLLLDPWDRRRQVVPTL